VPARTWVVLAVLAVIGGAILWQSGLEPYQKERVFTVMDPERDPYGGGYQVRQSKIAVGSGQLVGQGLGHGSQSLLLFLPAQHTDFAFSDGRRRPALPAPPLSSRPTRCCSAASAGPHWRQRAATASCWRF
jgi:hypothetical protein